MSECTCRVCDRWRRFLAAFNPVTPEQKAMTDEIYTDLASAETDAVYWRMKFHGTWNQPTDSGRNRAAKAFVIDNGDDDGPREAYWADDVDRRIREIEARNEALRNALNAVRTELSVEEVDPDDCRERCLSLLSAALACTTSGDEKHGNP